MCSDGNQGWISTSPWFEINCHFVFTVDPVKYLIKRLFFPVGNVLFFYFFLPIKETRTVLWGTTHLCTSRQCWLKPHLITAQITKKCLKRQINLLILSLFVCYTAPSPQPPPLGELSAYEFTQSPWYAKINLSLVNPSSHSCILNFIFFT